MPPPRTTVHWIFVAPRHAVRAAQTYADQALDWCYVGTNASQRMALARALAHLKRVDLADEVTRVAYEMKQPFLDWMIEVGQHQPDPVTWWASTLASSSPLQTDVFLLVCYTKVIEGWLRDAQPQLVRLVVVEDPWLGLTLRRQFRGDPRVVCEGLGLAAGVRDAVIWLGRVPRVALATAVSAMKSFLFTRRLFRRLTGPLNGNGPDTTLVYTWIRPECFLTPGQLTDPWTGRLETILRTEGRRVLRLTAPDIPPPLLRRLKQHAVPCIVTPRHLGLGDLVRALCSGFRVHHLGRLARCRGWNYRWLLVRETIREWGQADFGHYRLGYFAMRRVAARYGAGVQCVVYPFENQPWEKLLCLAWREQAPHVKLIGYQHAWVPPLLLPYALGRGAEALVPLPDLIVASSEFNLGQLREGGYPVTRLVNGGALRHEYLYTTGGEPAQQRTSPGGWDVGAPRVVLVTFPLSRPHAGNLLIDLLTAFKEPLVLGSERGEVVRFLLKFHPALQPAQLLGAGPALPPWMTISHAPMEQVLPDVDLLLYVGPTSSWWEAFLSGVPVLKYQADLIDIDAGNTDGLMPVPTCVRETLRASVERMLQDPPVVRRPRVHLVEKMYGRVNEDLWRAVVWGEPRVMLSAGRAP